MNWLRVLVIRVGALFTRRRLEQDMEDEIRGHLEMQIAENLRRGMDPQEANHAAQRSFGGVEQIKEAYRDRRGLPAVETLWQDLRYAARTLRKSPGFTSVATLTLALGIGANTAIFSVVEAVLLRPLPYKDPGRLVITTDAQLYKDFAAWKSGSRSFEDLAIYYKDSGISRVTLTGGGEPESVQGAFVSANLLPLMGVAPLVGRGFTSDEETRRERVVVMSQGLWTRRFGASPDAIGKMLQIDGMESQIIGVMPATFQFPSRSSQFWAPITTNRSWGDPALSKLDNPYRPGFYARWKVVGRLRSGVAHRQAQAEIDAIAARLQQAAPDLNRQLRPEIAPPSVNLDGNTRLALFVLLGAVCCVLLIACVNVANLVLARGASREREVAIRTALGAGRGRLIRQLFTESAALALLAGCLGLGLAVFGIRALVAFAPADIPRLAETGLDAVVLAFTVTISLAAAILFGLAPAWKISSSDPNASLKSGSRIAPGAMRTRRLLVAAEFALSVVLLTGGGLMLRSFLAVQAVDPGFRPERVLTMRITLPGGASDARRAALRDQTLDRVRALPGVQAAGVIDELFELGAPNILGLRAIEGRSPEPKENWSPLIWKTIGGDCLQALGAPLLRGRFFTGQDSPGSPLVAIIDESMARRYWPGEDPIGKRIKGQDRRGPNDDWVTVIGVARDMRRHGLDKQPTPHVFEWYKQAGGFPPYLVVRSAGDTKALAAALRTVVRGLDPTAILSPVTTLEQQLAEQLSPRRFQTGLLGLFSLMALALASVGIYGVMHYSVVQRTNEIGIRMALGARPADVVRMVIGQGLTLALTGLAVGLAGAWWLTRILSSLLFGVTPGDPTTFLVVSFLLTGVAVAASSIPAWRAARVDPLLALRGD